MKILVAIDGSKLSLKAVQRLIAHCDWYREPPKVEPARRAPAGAEGGAHQQGALERYYYQEEGESMLAAAKKKLDAAGIPYQARVLVGPVAWRPWSAREGAALRPDLHRHARHERASARRWSAA